MTLADAIADIERRFVVHEEIGMPVMSFGATDDKEHDTGARDWSRAPTGERYVVIYSNGVRKDGVVGAPPVLFRDEAMAIRWWTYAVLDYAEEIAPEAEWAKLHLYWREKPEFELASYILGNAVDAYQSGRADRVSHTIDMGTVYSRLLISRDGPNGVSE